MKVRIIHDKIRHDVYNLENNKPSHVCFYDRDALLVTGIETNRVKNIIGGGKVKEVAVTRTNAVLRVNEEGYILYIKK